MKRLAVFLCILVAMASLCSTQEPRAEMILNGTSFARGEFFSATFQLDQSIVQIFTVYAVVFMPNGSMLDALTLGPNLKPIASNVPRLAPPFSYPLIALNLPAGAPVGQYEVVAAFFDPAQPITGRQSAFLDVSGKFAITLTSDWYSQYGPNGTGDVVQIGSVYVASKQEGFGCANNSVLKWQPAMDWADDMTWLEKDDWRLPTIEELQEICENQGSLSSFTSGSKWSSTEYEASSAWWLYFSDCVPLPWCGKNSLGGVRSVRGVE